MLLNIILVFYLFFLFSANPVFSSAHLIEREDDDSYSRHLLPSVAQSRDNILNTINNIPDEILKKEIFTLLHQRDLPCVMRANQRFNTLMNDNLLWKAYAQRAWIVIGEELESRDYKALIKEHCTPSFIVLMDSRETLMEKQHIDIPNGIPHGFFLDGFGSITGISADGLVISGYALYGNGNRVLALPFRWTQGEGLEALGSLNYSTAWLEMPPPGGGISSDGSVIVGQGNIVNEDLAIGGEETQAFRWANVGEPEFLGSLTLENWNCAYSTNRDGSIIAGVSNIIGDGKNKKCAFRWTKTEGLQSLGSLNNGENSVACGMNIDGSIIVGWADDFSEGRKQDKAFRWTKQAGMQSLDPKMTEASGISAIDSTIIGRGRKDDGTLSAVRWTEKTGMQFLGVLNAGDESTAVCTNANGSRVSGISGFPNQLGQIFLWTPDKGMQSIEKILHDQGGLATGRPLKLFEVSAITLDGTIVVGRGKYTDKNVGHAECFLWRAVIPRYDLF